MPLGWGRAAEEIGKGVQSVSTALDELFTSDEELGQLRLGELKERTRVALAEISLLAQQLRVAEAQMQHPHWFVAGGRPSIQWIAALAALWSVLLVPVLNGIFGLSLVAADWETLLVASGLGGTVAVARTAEKMRGVARENFQPAARKPVEGLPWLTSQE